MAGMTDNHVWLEFVHSTLKHCGLCGNTGLIDTRGRVITPAGVECGVLRFCICPNGRALKESPTASGLMRVTQDKG